jgi:hypothetical protein
MHMERTLGLLGPGRQAKRVLPVAEALGMKAMCGEGWERENDISCCSQRAAASFCCDAYH